MVGWVLAAACLQGAEGDARPRDELLARTAALAAAPGYVYRYTPDVTATVDPAEQEAPGKSQIQLPRDSWRVEFSTTVPLRYQKGRIEFWREGARVASLGRADEWFPIELGGVKRRPADAPRPSPMERIATEIGRFPHPHDFLADALATAQRIARAEPPAGAAPEGAESSDYVVELSPAAIRAFLHAGASSSGAKPPRSGEKADPEAGTAGEGGEDDAGPAESPARAGDDGAGEAAPPAKPRGIVRIHVESERLVRLELELEAPAKGATRTVHARYEILEVGGPATEIPAPALAVLRAK